MSTIAASRVQYLQSRISRYDDQSAYKEVFTSLYPALIQFTTSITRSRQSAEEIVSDLFLKLWEKRKSLCEIENLRVYCFVAARNRSVNLLETQKKRRHESLEGHRSSLVYASPDPEQSMISAEMMRRVQEAVDSLPDRCQEAFKLVKEYGFRYQEAAEILQVSPKTIENQLAIALKKISANIGFDPQRAIRVTAHIDG